MKPIFYLTLIVLSFSNISFSQKIEIINPQGNKSGYIKGDIFGCGYSKSNNQRNIEIYSPRQRELDQINKILKYTGLSSNFEIYSANIINAVALVANNKR